MGNALISFLCALGASTWIGNKFYKRTGGNTVKSLSAGAVAGLIIFLVILSILWQIS